MSSVPMPAPVIAQAPPPALTLEQNMVLDEFASRLAEMELPIDRDAMLRALQQTQWRIGEAVSLMLENF